jgi:hypothetical protein
MRALVFLLVLGCGTDVVDIGLGEDARPEPTPDDPSDDPGEPAVPDDTDPVIVADSADSADTGLLDADFDGYSPPEDCNDQDGAIHPGVLDLCDGVDEDCDGDTDEDVKRDWILVTVDAADVYTISRTTAATAPMVALSQTVSGLNTMDVRTDGLPIVHSNQGTLWDLDVCTGDIDLIGPTTVGDVGGMAFDRDGRLWGLDQTHDMMVRFDPATGAATPVSPLGFDLGNNGLAYDCATDTFYGIQGNGGLLFTIDGATGTVGPMQPTGLSFSGVGVDFDHQTREVIASTGGYNGLWAIDPNTLATRFIGTMGIRADDIALHPPCP